MGDAVLANNDGAIFQGGGDMVREIGVDSRDNSDLVERYRADASKKVNRALEAPAEQSCAR